MLYLHEAVSPPPLGYLPAGMPFVPAVALQLVIFTIGCGLNLPVRRWISSKVLHLAQTRQSMASGCPKMTMERRAPDVGILDGIRQV